MKHFVVSSKPSLEEREMTVNIVQNKDGEWIAELFTNIHKYANRCTRQGWKQVSETIHKDGTWISAQFTAPAKAISIGKAVRPKRVVSEEQKQAAKERMQRWRENKANEN